MPAKLPMAWTCTVALGTAYAFCELASGKDNEFDA
jgi:hypothetical protein